MSDGAELRLDVLAGQWVVVAAHRQDRPNRPAQDCPFCVGGLEAPEAYVVRAFPNRWPVLSPGVAAVAAAAGVDATPARGASEVVLYSPDHDASLASIGAPRAAAVVDLWAERTAALLARPEVEYVLVFENRGPDAGATIDHPHGQIYGFPFVPPVPAREAQVAARHGCGICAELQREAATSDRRVTAGDGWSAWVPYASGWPFGLLVAPDEHRGSLPELAGPQRGALAAVLVDALGRYDRLFDVPCPYMLWIHQAPGEHLHVHVAPPWRSEAAVRYVAAGELGSGTLFNPVAPEAAAEALRGAGRP